MIRLSFLLLILMVALSLSSQDYTSKYIVFLNTNPNRAELPQAEVETLQQAHRANMDSLSGAGRLIAAGPFHGGGGIFVLVGSSISDVQELIFTDPAIKAGRFNIEIFDLNMNIGGICPVGESFDMAEYQFMRYIPVDEVIGKTKDKKIIQLTKRRMQYLKASFMKRGLIAEADFGDKQGGFLVAFKPTDDEFETFLKYDPWLKSGLYTLQTKILWIAQGSFCERSQP